MGPGERLVEAQLDPLGTPGPLGPGRHLRPGAQPEELLPRLDRLAPPVPQSQVEQVAEPRRQLRVVLQVEGQDVRPREDGVVGGAAPEEQRRTPATPRGKLVEGAEDVGPAAHAAAASDAPPAPEPQLRRVREAVRPRVEVVPRHQVQEQVRRPGAVAVRVRREPAGTPEPVRARRRAERAPGAAARVDVLV